MSELSGKWKRIGTIGHVPCIKWRNFFLLNWIYNVNLFEYISIWKLNDFNYKICLFKKFKIKVRKKSHSEQKETKENERRKRYGSYSVKWSANSIPKIHYFIPPWKLNNVSEYELNDVFGIRNSDALLSATDDEVIEILRHNAGTEGQK